MLKKVAKTLDEMAKNEELMGGIMAAAEGMEDDGTGPQDEEDYQQPALGGGNIDDDLPPLP